MKKLFLAVVLTALSSFASAGWVEGYIVGVRDDNPKAVGGVWVTNYPAVNLAPYVWHRVNASAWGVPTSAKAVLLVGLLIITHGTTAETCDLTIAFRAPGDTLDGGNYVGQTIEALNGSGQRSNMASWAPLVNGEFEFQWRFNTSGTWPTNCSYAINLAIQEYIR